MLVLVAAFAGTASARPSLTPFCAAVRAFNADRPPSNPEAVASVQRLSERSPAPVRTRLRAILRALERGNPSVVLARAAGSPPLSAVSAAGRAVTRQAGQRCGVPVNFLAAVPTGISPRPVDPAVWARTVCTSLSAWGQSLQASGSKLLTPLSGVTTTLPEVRSALSQFLGAAIFRTQELVDQLDAAGTPNAASGNAFAAFIHDGVTQAQQAFTAAVPAAQALPNDPQGFQVDGQALVQRLDDTGRQVAALAHSAEARINAPQIQRALAAEPACAGIG